MGAALGQWADVVHFLGGCYLAVFFAPLTQRVDGDIPIAYVFPRSAVSFLGSGVTLVFFIASLLLLLMLWTEPPGDQLGTAGMAAGCFRFVWHVVLTISLSFASPQVAKLTYYDARPLPNKSFDSPGTLQRAKQKPTRFPAKAFVTVFDITIVHRVNANTPSSFPHLYPNSNARR